MTGNTTESVESFESEEEDYSINTSTLYHNEFTFIRDPDAFTWIKVFSDYDRELEHLIQVLLVENVEPVVDYSDDQREYLIDRYENFNTAHFNPIAFRINYFVIATDKPRIRDSKNSLQFTGDQYYYFYSYDQHFIVKKKELEDYQFELLFAFALRQCDLMKINSFLQYHLISNFDGMIKQYCKYLTQINRKFINVLFTSGTYDSIKDWVTENESKADIDTSKKIKTHLTVPQLAYLFKALMDNSHLDDNTAKRIIEWASESFESKVMSDISEKSFRNCFYTQTVDVLDFWGENFDKMSKNAIRLKQKNIDLTH